MELSKQEMELFLLLPELQSKNFFYKMFLTFTSKLYRGFLYTSTRLQVLAKPELGTTPAPAC